SPVQADRALGRARSREGHERRACGGLPIQAEEGGAVQTRPRPDGHAQHEGRDRLLPLFRLAETRCRGHSSGYLHEVQNSGGAVMAQSSIEWTQSTWNPLTGCTKISPGCKHCYAERMAKRLHGMGQPRYVNGFELTLHDDVLELPLTWKKPQRI